MNSSILVRTSTGSFDLLRSTSGEERRGAGTGKEPRSSILQSSSLDLPT